MVRRAREPDPQFALFSTSSTVMPIRGGGFLALSFAPGRSRLAGLVEIDETEIACRRKNDPLTGGGGRSHQGKMLVVGVVEVEDGGLGPGRIRLSQVPDYSATSLHAFLAANLGPGATAKTDGWSG